jgi:uncharacterized membrane protein (DUF373 family)
MLIAIYILIIHTFTASFYAFKEENLRELITNILFILCLLIFAQFWGGR